MRRPRYLGGARHPQGDIEISNIKLNINVTLGDLVISPDGPGNVILTMANNEGRISETVNVNELKEALALLDLTVNGKKSHKKKESV